MSNDLFGTTEIDELLHDENIFDGVFESLRRIWADPNAMSDRDLPTSEYRTRLLERELAKLYPPLYEDLIDQMGGHPLTEWEDGCGVIMDALSLREGFRLEQDLEEDHDWEVELSWAPIECLPSETQFICREWFDGHSPSAVSRDDFRFVGDLDVPQLPGTDTEYVWTRHPDQRLEGALKGNYSSEEIEDIYADVKALLEDVIRESIHDDFLITSDHGYINHLGNSPYSLTDEQEEALSSKFSSRFRDVGNGSAYQLLEEANIIERERDHYLVRGHYKWTKPGATKKIMHGGLSLTECMTPVLRITT
mgnify:CR=1 FL=1